MDACFHDMPFPVCGHGISKLMDTWLQKQGWLSYSHNSVCLG